MRGFLSGIAAVALLASAAVAAGVPASKHSAKETARAVAAGLANPERADQAGDDTRRKAAEVLAFSGVGPGDEVLDFLPGAGYWTRIFSGVVGKTGHVYAIWPAAGAKYAAKTLSALEARHMSNVTLKVLDAGIVGASEPVDLVWTVQNYHDINNNGGEAAIDAMNAAVLKALKPGGTYIVIDHADPGSGLASTNTTHRIDPATVKTQVVRAGFEFVGESTALANPADDHKANVFDPAIRGHTDQFVYKFRKPR
ncbi:class I SAM-dependent methyltransferase [Sphingomonas sp. MMS24-J45]|uniref:class I SAM-dependent methyltransferase n=1 Tax=Sphingomonas sp. MMS24-J45 TaxID=3238806 RepID=UPI00384C69E7